MDPLFNNNEPVPVRADVFDSIQKMRPLNCTKNDHETPTTSSSLSTSTTLTTKQQAVATATTVAVTGAVAIPTPATTKPITIAKAIPATTNSGTTSKLSINSTPFLYPSPQLQQRLHKIQHHQSAVDPQMVYYNENSGASNIGNYDHILQKQHQHQHQHQQQQQQQQQQNDQQFLYRSGCRNHSDNSSGFMQMQSRPIQSQSQTHYHNHEQQQQQKEQQHYVTMQMLAGSVQNRLIIQNSAESNSYHSTINQSNSQPHQATQHNNYDHNHHEQYQQYTNSNYEHNNHHLYHGDYEQKNHDNHQHNYNNHNHHHQSQQQLHHHLHQHQHQHQHQQQQQQQQQQHYQRSNTVTRQQNHQQPIVVQDAAAAAAENTNYMENCALHYLQNVIQCLNENPGQFDTIASCFLTIFDGMENNFFVLSIAMEDIFEESIAKPNFRYMGAKLYNLLHMLNSQSDSLFYTLLNRKLDFHRNEVQTYMENNQQNKVRETALFLAELYMQLRNDETRIHFIAENIVHFLKQLLSIPNESNIRCICLTLKLAGYDLTTDCPNDMKYIMEQLETINAESSNKYALLSSVIALHKNNWGRKMADSESVSNTDTENKGQNRLSNDPVFYGPDGCEITEEECEFLTSNANEIQGPNENDDDDNAPDFDVDYDLEMDEEQAKDYKEFIRQSKAS